MTKIKYIAYIFLTLFFPIEGKGVPTPQEESRQTTLLLQQLDSTIKKIQQYDAAHEKNIEAIKQQLRRQKGGLKEEIVLTDKLIEVSRTHSRCKRLIIIILCIKNT